MHRPSQRRERRLPVLALALSLAGVAAAPAAATVTITMDRPLDGDVVASPTTVAAAATTSASNARVTAWQIYVDGVLAYGTGGPAAAISTGVAMDDGDHELIVRAWDSTGDYNSASLTVTVGVCTGFTVDLQSPTAGSVSSPVEVAAAASSCHRVTGFAVYVDDRRVYQQPGSRSLDTRLDLPLGHHSLQVRATDSSRATASSDVVPIDVESREPVQRPAKPAPSPPPPQPPPPPP
jgi:hypothetical protein